MRLEFIDHMRNSPVNNSEAFVFGVCRRSILSLWCNNNPQGKNGDELCDILVVCHPHLIIISVKDVSLNRDKSGAVAHKRWERKAIKASVKQIYGAERWLSTASTVVRQDGSPGLELPAAAERQIHRIALAFGSDGEVPVGSGDFGKGFVHVMAEHCFNEILTELDTITDLLEYLTATEACAARGCGIVVDGSEANLLGWYLFNGRTFPKDVDMLVVEDNIWKEVRQRPDFRRGKEADRDSYIWDKLIESLADPRAKVLGGTAPQLRSLELALRQMALETRFSRRMLGRDFREFLEQATVGKLRSRILKALSETIYVFVYFSGGEDAQWRLVELGNRCCIARHRIGSGAAVVGVGISKHMPAIGSAYDLTYLNLSGWLPMDDELAIRMSADLGYFASSSLQESHEDEYPVGL